MNYLSDYTQQAQTDLFNKTGAFFAFSNKQFEERYKEENKPYVQLHAGLICPKKNIDELLDGLSNIQKAGVKKDVEENGAEKIIEREYFNHECQLTLDTSSALRAIKGHIKQFPELFTTDLIEKTFKECFNKAVKNNWF